MLAVGTRNDVHLDLLVERASHVQTTGNVCSWDATACSDHGGHVHVQCGSHMQPLMLCAEVCHILKAHHVQCLASIPVPALHVMAMSL
jgi:hypothetical protein